MEFKKYGKIKIVGHEDNEGIFSDSNDEIVIEEKIDGGNFRFVFKDGNIVFGSRTQQLTSDEGEDTNIQKDFLRCLNHVRGCIAKSEVNCSELDGLLFYGESCHKHTMDYDWENIPSFLGFDVYDIENDRYIYVRDAKEIFESMGLDFVPIIEHCKTSDIKEITEDMIPISEYSSHLAEGIVFKNYDKQIFAKLVREKFKEKNKEVFGGGKKFAKTDDEYLTAVYCTNARIDKMIFTLIDEGIKLDMPMMKHLPTRVYKDIWEENWQEITNFKGKACDFQKFKKFVTKRCLAVLRQVIVNNSLEPKDL